jgi:hypothetical protein
VDSAVWPVGLALAVRQRRAPKSDALIAFAKSRDLASVQFSVTLKPTAIGAVSYLYGW